MVEVISLAKGELKKVKRKNIIWSFEKDSLSLRGQYDKVNRMSNSKKDQNEKV